MDRLLKLLQDETFLESGGWSITGHLSELSEALHSIGIVVAGKTLILLWLTHRAPVGVARWTDESAILLAHLLRQEQSALDSCVSMIAVLRVRLASPAAQALFLQSDSLEDLLSFMADSYHRFARPDGGTLLNEIDRVQSVNAKELVT